MWDVGMEAMNFFLCRNPDGKIFFLSHRSENHLSQDACYLKLNGVGIWRFLNNLAGLVSVIT